MTLNFKKELFPRIYGWLLNIAYSILNSSTMTNVFSGFLSQFSTNFYEILHTLFAIHVVTTAKLPRRS